MISYLHLRLSLHSPPAKYQNLDIDLNDTNNVDDKVDYLPKYRKYVLALKILYIVSFLH